MNSAINTPWKKVIEVHPNDNFILELTWEDGTQTYLDLNERIHQKDKFWRLRNPRYFKKVSIDILGGICWPEEEDLSPNFLACHSRSALKKME